MAPWSCHGACTHSGQAQGEALSSHGARLQVLEEPVALAAEHDASRHHRDHLAGLAEDLWGHAAWVARAVALAVGWEAEAESAAASRAEERTCVG